MSPGEHDNGDAERLDLAAAVATASLAVIGLGMAWINTRSYEQGKGDDLWRRSLYTYWKRASPPPSMLTLDAPTREFCTVRRFATNTPLQALVLWDDPQFVEAARKLEQDAKTITGQAVIVTPR